MGFQVLPRVQNLSGNSILFLMFRFEINTVFRGCPREGKHTDTELAAVVLAGVPMCQARGIVLYLTSSDLRPFSCPDRQVM